MKKIFKVFLIIVAVILLIIGSLIVYLLFNQDKIQSYAVGKLNEQLIAKVDVKDIQLDLFNAFPYVSFDFRDVHISDPIRDNASLLDAQHVFVSFNLYHILRQKYTIQQIAIDSGTCNIFIDKNGNPNYNIIRVDSAGAKKDESFSLELKKIQLSRLRVRYDDRSEHFLTETFIKELTFSGSFKNGNDKLNAKGDLFVNKLAFNGTNIIHSKQVNIDMGLKMDENKQIILIDKGGLELEQLKLDVRGTIDHKKKPRLAIDFAAKELSIQSFLSVLPFTLPKQFNQYKSNGDIAFKGSINGDASSPAVYLSFHIRNGEFIDDQTGLKATAINLEGYYSNGEKHNALTSELDLKHLACKLNDGALSGSLNIRDFNAPFIKTDFNYSSSINTLLKLTGQQALLQADGNIQANIQLKGKLADIRQSNIDAFESGGFISLSAQNIKFDQGKRTIASFITELNVVEDDISIAKLEIANEGSDISASGKLNGAFGYFLSKDKSMNMDVVIKSKNLDMQQVVIPASANDTTPFRLPKRISMNASLDVGQLSYAKFHASAIHGKFSWKGNTINADNFSGKAMDGQVTLNGQLETAPNGNMLVTTKLQANDILINELFTEFGNFGQKEITDEHIRGRATLDAEMISVWSDQLICDLDKLYIIGNISIQNGELINYKPLEALSRFASVEDLRHLKFALLQNRIEISKQVIYIPEMEIKNNALNLSLAGTHTFSNYLDYKMRIRLSELLNKKRKQQKPNEFNEVEEEPSGGLNLYLTMKGPADHPIFAYDKISTKKKVNEDLKKEKESIKEVLKKELGIKKEDEIKEKKTNSDELEFEQE